MTHPDSRRPQRFYLCAPGGLQAIKMGSEPLCSRERLPPPRTQMPRTQIEPLVNRRKDARTIARLQLISD